MKFRGDCHVLVTDDDVAKSLEYLFKKGTEEVNKFGGYANFRQFCSESIYTSSG